MKTQVFLYKGKERIFSFKTESEINIKNYSLNKYRHFREKKILSILLDANIQIVPSCLQCLLGYSIPIRLSIGEYEFLVDDTPFLFENKLRFAYDIHTKLDAYIPPAIKKSEGKIINFLSEVGYDSYLFGNKITINSPNKLVFGIFYGFLGFKISLEKFFLEGEISEKQLFLETGGYFPDGETPIRFDWKEKYLTFIIKNMILPRRSQKI